MDPLQPTAPAADQWYVAIGDQKRGPYSLEQLREVLAQEQLPTTVQVWTPSMTNWQPWGQVPQLRSVDWNMAPARSYAGPSSFAEPTMLRDFLAFRRMVTPMIIQIIFWIGIAAVVLGSLGMLFSSEVPGAAKLIALPLLIVGPFGIRIVCETMILFFRINETLTDIKNGLGGR